MPLSRPARGPLRSLVALLWAAEAAPAAQAGSGRELVLPTGATHLVFRLEDRPLRLFEDGNDEIGRSLDGPVIGGARAGPYLRDVSQPAASVGALLRPGAAALLLGVPAGALAGVHTPLEAVWGAAAVDGIRARLVEAGAPARRLELLERILAARLSERRGIDPQVARAVARFASSQPVAAVARASGWSHRHFTRAFREAVGLNPKAYGRVLRFGRVLERLGAEPGISWAELAAAEGYADQPHLTREFRALAGLSPGRYRALAPRFARHVRL